MWLLLVLGPIAALNYVLAITIHEFGHYLVAKHLGYTLSKFSISPYGVALSYADENLDYRDEVKIAVAGPLANFVSSLFVVGIWWLFPSVYHFSESFVTISTLLALFNLFPAYPLDGGRVFICLSQFFFSGKIAKKITVFLNILLSGLFFVLFVAFCFINFNPTYLLFSVFLIGGIIDLNFTTKFEKVSVFCKKRKEFAKPSVVLISPQVTLGQLVSKMQTSKTYLFCVQLDSGRCFLLGEEMILNLLKNYQINDKK